MPLFGYSHKQLLDAQCRGYRDGLREASDEAGRKADHVWRLWITIELKRGNKPPLFAPEHVIAEVRERLELRKEGT